MRLWIKKKRVKTTTKKLIVDRLKLKNEFII